LGLLLDDQQDQFRNCEVKSNQALDFNLFTLRNSLLGFFLPAGEKHQIVPDSVSSCQLVKNIELCQRRFKSVDLTLLQAQNLHNNLTERGGSGRNCVLVFMTMI
jgi:hypothetical protein